MKKVGSSCGAPIALALWGVVTCAAFVPLIAADARLLSANQVCSTVGAGVSNCDDGQHNHPGWTCSVTAQFHCFFVCDKCKNYQTQAECQMRNYAAPEHCWSCQEVVDIKVCLNEFQKEHYGCQDLSPQGQNPCGNRKDFGCKFQDGKCVCDGSVSKLGPACPRRDCNYYSI
ncbi:MAG: hypothetical protein HYS13_07080 [Planctomycetia bacterium]|nr:hypothetical protein [Planctomycetia bacterium]